MPLRVAGGSSSAIASLAFFARYPTLERSVPFPQAQNLESSSSAARTKCSRCVLAMRVVMISPLKWLSMATGEPALGFQRWPLLNDRHRLRSALLGRYDNQHAPQFIDLTGKVQRIGFQYVHGM